MDSNEDWRKEFEKFNVVQICPKCGKLTLKFSEGNLICSNCSFNQDVGEIK
jgi:ribosomal protein L37AE/L43A